MSLVTVEVLAQYFDENGKPKGGQNFVFQADSDTMMYTDSDMVKNVIQKLIDAKMAGWEGRYEYREHDLVFIDDVELDGDTFESLIEQSYKEIPS